MRTLSFDFSGLAVKVDQTDDPELLLNKLLQKSSDDPDILDERIPYWAEVWPSAIGLSEYIAENRELINGKTVLEIGCGPGLPGIVAAMAGGKVELTDYMQDAIDLAAHNWALNFSSKANCSILDWRTPGDRKADVVLASDVAYESRSFPPLLNALKTLVSSGGMILLSEPNRKFTSAFFKSLSKEGFTHKEIQKEVIKDSIVYTISVYILVRSV